MRKLGIALMLFVATSPVCAQQWSDVTAKNPVGFVPFPLDGQPISSFNPEVLATGCNASQTSCGTVGIGIQDFAEKSYVDGQFDNLGGQIGDLNSQFQSFSSSIGAELKGFNSSLAKLENSVTSGFADVDSRLTALNASVNARFAQVKSQLTSMNANIATLNGEVAQLNAGLDRANAGVERANELAVMAGAMKDAIPNDGDRFAVRLNMAAWNSTAAGSIGFSANVSNSMRVSVDYGRSQNQNMFSGGMNMSFH